MLRIINRIGNLLKALKPISPKLTANTNEPLGGGASRPRLLHLCPDTKPFIESQVIGYAPDGQELIYHHL